MKYKYRTCTGLTSVTIHSNVTSISTTAFAGSGLSTIVVDSKNTTYDTRDNCNAIIETASNTLVLGCKNTVIPNSVTTIGRFAFNSCSGLTEVTIPNSVTSIGDYAFYDCRNLTSVEIPNSVTTIGSSAFESCWRLREVTIPNSVTFIGDKAFYACSILTNVFSKIEEPFAFGSSAFSISPSTCTLTVPAGTRDAYIAAGWTENVFKGGVVEAPEPTVADLTADIYHLWDGAGTDATVTNPTPSCAINLNVETGIVYGDNSVRVDRYADLSDWDYLTVTVTSGTPRLFFNSHGEEDRIIVYPYNTKYVKSNKNGIITYDLAAIKADAGYVHLNAIKAKAPDAQVIIGEMKLATVEEYVPENPVRRFTDLTTDMFHKWTLEEPVEILPDQPFCAYNLFNSTGMIYGDGEVNPNQFADLSEWDYLTIAATNGTPRLLFNRIYNPEAEEGTEEWKGANRLEINSTSSEYVESAENGLFVYDLKAIRENSNGMVRLHAIKGADGDVTVYSLKLSKESPAEINWNFIYFADANVKAICVGNWDTDGDGELSKDEAAAVTDLGEVFKGNEDITSFDELQYFTGLTSIGGSAFHECTSLTSVTIPEGVTSIGTDAFCHTGLENFTVPGTVTTIDWGAFTWNSSLKRIVFEEGVESVGNIQFYGCSNLEEVVFPSTLTGGQMLDMFNYGGANKLTHIVMPINWPLSRHAELFGGGDLSHSVLFTIPAGSAKNYLQKGYYNISDNSELDWMREEFEAEATRVEALKTAEGITASTEAKEALEAAITTARSATNNADSYLAIGAQINAIKSAAKTFLAASTITAETDVTAIIRNPQFDRVDMGWNVAEGTAYQGCSVGYQNDGNYNEHTNGEVTIHDFLEAWWNDVPLGDGGITQTIGNLPAGRYRLECDAIASWKADVGVEVTGVNLFAGAKKTPVATEDEKPQHFTVDFTQYRTADCTIGIDISNTTANWVAMDNVHLYWVSGISSPVDENTAYYLQNVETGKYLNQGNAYGKRAVLADEGLPVKVVKGADGSYTVEFLEGSDNDHLLYRYRYNEEVYVDYNSTNENQDPYWIISDADTEGTYHIQSVSNSESMYLGNNPTKEAHDQNNNALGVYNDVDGSITDTEGMNITWRFVKVDEEDPIVVVPEGEDMTDLIVNPRFENNTVEGWTGAQANTGSENTNHQTHEFWNKNFDMYQTITGIPNGFYLLKYKAFQRPGSYTVAYNDYVAGENKVTATLYANNSQKLLKHICDDMTNDMVGNCSSDTYYSLTLYAQMEDNYMPNTMLTARAYFDAGYYADSIVVQVTDGQLTFGIRDDHNADVTGWVIFSDFELYYQPGTYVIDFADANVKALCVDEWDTNEDGELNLDEASVVTDLGEVFKQNTDITSFDELQYFTGLTSIGENAFEECSNLTSVALPSTVESIEAWAFRGTALVSLAIPNHVTSIATHAYYNCQQLTSVNLGSGVSSIGWKAFATCPALKTILVSADNQMFYSPDGSNAVIERETNTLVVGCKSTIIPVSVTTIDEVAFEGCWNLTSIELPASITSIGNQAFSYNINLNSIISYIETPFEFGTDAFGNISSDCVLTIPYGTRDAYIAAGWTEEVFKGGIQETLDKTNLIVNPRFENNTVEGWTVAQAGPGTGGTSHQTHEFWNKNFDMYQTITGISNGSYLLKYKAFQRPGSYTVAYNDYVAGENKVTATLYANNSQKLLKHICDEMQPAKVNSSDSKVGESYIPNTMEGARAYFDAGYYADSIVVEVTDGQLTFGIRDDHNADVTGWVIFSDFELYHQPNVEEEEGNVLYAEERTGLCGGNITIPVLLKTDQDYAAMECQVTLPEGFTLRNAQKGDLLSEDHQLTTLKTDDNIWQILVYTTNRTNFSDTEGVLLELTLGVDNNVAAGNYEMILSNIVISDVDLNQEDLADTRSNIVIDNSTQIGDATNDGRVNVTDIMAVANWILKIPMTTFNEQAADVNGDGRINVTDIMGIANIILKVKGN